MGYQYEDSVEPLKAPELGTPRPGLSPKRQHGFVAWLERADEDSKIVIGSANVVTLLLVEGTSKALERTWRKLEVILHSMGEQYQRGGRTDLWGKAAKSTSLATKKSVDPVGESGLLGVGQVDQGRGPSSLPSDPINSSLHPSRGGSSCTPYW